MRSFNSILTLALGAASAMAAPSPAEEVIVWDGTTDKSLGSRAAGGVEIAVDVNFAGTHGFAKQPFGVCIQLGAPYDKTISAIGPDTFNVIVAFEDHNCGSSARLAVFNPGFKDLRTVGWNDRIRSFKVFKLSDAACLRSNEFSQQPVLGATSCNSCCNGCNRSGTDCCPDGVSC